MQCVASRSSQGVARKSATKAVVARAPLNVVCKATKVEEVAKKAAVIASTLPAMLVSSPAFALVDDRMNGDGTGLPLGVNDSTLGFVLFGVFATVWTIWFTSQKDLGDFEDPEDGLAIK